MSNQKNHSQSLLAFLCVIASAFLFLTSCANNLKELKPPLKIPINLQQSEELIDIEMRITEHLVYHFALRFFFKADDQADRKRVRALLGGYETDKYGKVREPGVPTPITLTIAMVDNGQERIAYNEQIDPILTSWGHGRFTKNIGFCDLKPGLYKVRLKNHRVGSEFSSVPTYFLVGYDKFKSTFDPEKLNRSKACIQ